MKVIARSTLRKFYESQNHADSREALEAWYHEVRRANWKSPAEIKEQYKSASILKKNRVVFNICGNKYRLIVKINYRAEVVYVRFVGSHKEYNQINAEEI